MICGSGVWGIELEEFGPEDIVDRDLDGLCDARELRPDDVLLTVLLADSDSVLPVKLQSTGICPNTTVL